jgi:hypothetical protein
VASSGTAVPGYATTTGPTIAHQVPQVPTVSIPVAVLLTDMRVPDTTPTSNINPVYAVSNQDIMPPGHWPACEVPVAPLARSVAQWQVVSSALLRACGAYVPK